MDPERAQQILAAKDFGAPLKSLSTDTLISQAKNLLSSQSIGLLEKEYRLFHTTRAIADRPASAPLKQLLVEVSAYESKLYWSVEHVARMREVIAYPIAGTAAAILQDWRLNEQTQALIVNGSLQLDRLDAFLSGAEGRAQTHVFRRLTERLSEDQVLRLVTWTEMNTALFTSQQLVDLMLRTQGNSLNEALAQRLINADRANAGMIRSLTDLLAPMVDDQKYHLLSGLVRSPGYGATAIQLLATTDQDHELSNQLLLESLGDRKLGGDAAYVLSDRLSPHLINELGDRINSGQKLDARRAQLALSLSDHDMAREMLRLTSERAGAAKTAGGGQR